MRRLHVSCRAFGIGLGLGVAASSSIAQTQTDASRQPGNAYQLSLQLAVPSSPAFKLVDVDASTILRPTSFHQLTTAASNFISENGGFSLPKELGVEVAPFFLAKGRTLTLDEYQRKQLLYRFRVSAAVKQSEGAGSPTNLALGLRFSPKDATDPRTSPTLIRQLTEVTTAINRICVREAAAAGPPTRFDSPGVVSCADPRGREKGLESALKAIPVDSANRAAERQELLTTLQAFRVHKAQVEGEIAQLDSQVATIKTTWENERWNKHGLDFAVAASGQTADSLGHDPRFAALAAWLFTAAPVRNWGQVVLGLNAQRMRDSLSAPMLWTGNVAAAFYVGGNRYKGFIEAQGSLKESAKGGALANAGAEIFILPGLWANGAAGWQLDPDDKKGRLVTRFSLRTKFPLLTPSVPLGRVPPTQ
jgi:hypothetical protein